MGDGNITGRRWFPALVIALAFFVVSALTITGYGQTWDELETFAASRLNIGVVKAVVTGATPEPWTFHELPGYYFVVDLIRGAFVWVVSTKLGLMEDVLGFHFVNIVFSTMSVFLFHLLAQNVSGRTRIATLSTIGLILLPQFLAHAQNNPKDLPGLFVYVLTIYVFTRPGACDSVRDLLCSGLALGLALTTSVSSLFLVPILGLWLALTRTTTNWKNIALAVVVGAITAFALWPWLWTDPIGHLMWAARHISAKFHIDSVKVLYLGTIQEAWDLPWHYSLVSLLAVTPVLYLAGAAASFGSFRARLERGAPSPRSAATLGVLWFAIPILAEMGAPMHYDGARHLLVTAPGLCLLAGVGIDAVWRWLAPSTLTAMACALATLAYAGTEVIRVYPYHNAYLNEVARLWLPGPAEDVFEIEYWGQSYKEGAEWLKTHAEPNADLYVGLDTVAADRYLGRRSQKLTDKNLHLFEDRARPAYFMVVTRKAMYPSAIDRIVKSYEPIFVIQRQKGTLLKIFSNQRPIRER